MLTNIVRMLGGDVNVKFAAILSSYGSVRRAVCESLDSFGVLSEFECQERHSTTVEIPKWAGNRDFEVRTAKIRVVGANAGADVSYYFCNLDDCWASLALSISKRLKCCVVLVRSAPSFAGTRDYIQEFILMKSGEITRTMRVSYDDGWTFYQSGAHLPFEDVGQYGKRRIKDRLSKPYLTSLMAAVTAKATEGDAPFSNYEWDRRGMARDHGAPVH